MVIAITCLHSNENFKVEDAFQRITSHICFLKKIDVLIVAFSGTGNTLFFIWCMRTLNVIVLSRKISKSWFLMVFTYHKPETISGLQIRLQKTVIEA